jgi:molybdate transport system ATP-binding protein
MKLSQEDHFAILVEQEQVLDLKKLFPRKKNGSAIFSENTLKEMIDEESRRDTSVIMEREGQSLRSMSSGERKVALFKYLISLHPEILVVEDFYEHLDVVNQAVLEKELISTSKEIRIVQVVRKEKELFSFIKDFFIIDNENQLSSYKYDFVSFFNQNVISFSEVSIPKTTTHYSYEYKTFVKLKDVNVSFYDKQVLKDIRWEIKLGEFWQLIGENGAGKTTLLSLITGDSHKAYGQDIILFDKLKGTEENVWEIKQKIGYFTSNITELFNKRHSALHMVLSGFYDSIGLYVKPLDLHIRLAKEWLSLIGLLEKSNKTFATLSLSEQRMVLIARAMVKHPPLLILDEPTSGLNVESTRLIVALINKISKETKTTIIYVSHRMEQGLSPDKTYKLNVSSDGSEGNIVFQ